MINLRNDYCGVCHPKILEALCSKSKNTYVGYGLDNESIEAENKIKMLINNSNASVYFTVGGTSTNKIVIAHALKSYGAVIACDSGHINVHETGAIEATGHKVIGLESGSDGKLSAFFIFDGFFSEMTDKHLACMIVLEGFFCNFGNSEMDILEICAEFFPVKGDDLARRDS